jgi:hypothetical protein
MHDCSGCVEEIEGMTDLVSRLAATNPIVIRNVTAQEWPGSISIML